MERRKISVVVRGPSYLGEDYSMDEILAASEVLDKVKDKEGLTSSEESLKSKLDSYISKPSKIKLTREDEDAFRDILTFGYPEF